MNKDVLSQHQSIFSNTLTIQILQVSYNTNLSTGPPRPPRQAGRVSSLLLLVSGSRKRVKRNKGESGDVIKSRGSVLLSTAAKLRVVAERDLRERRHGRELRNV